jgi:hypothetical protein
MALDTRLGKLSRCSENGRRTVGLSVLRQLNDKPGHKLTQVCECPSLD